MLQEKATNNILPRVCVEQGARKRSQLFFSLQEGKTEQLYIRREGKQMALSSQNKLLLGEAKQLETIQADMEVRDLQIQ